MAQLNQNEILLVADEPLIRMVAADALADCGIFAWEAGDAEEALTVLHQHPEIRLLFTDLNMPGNMDGVELAHVVHNVRPDIELVLASAATVVANDVLPDHGTFLRKPYALDRMVEIVETKLGIRY